MIKVLIKSLAGNVISLQNDLNRPRSVKKKLDSM